FVAPQLPPGAYTISVEKQGFKKVEKSNVVLSTSDKLNAGDFTLEVGQVTEAVQIQADAGQLQIKTETGERADLVSGQQLRSIGLNGRNAIDLARLVPGVISGGAASGSGASTVTNITDRGRNHAGLLRKQPRAVSLLLPDQSEGFRPDLQLEYESDRGTFSEDRYVPYITGSGSDIASLYGCVADDQHQRSFLRDRAIRRPAGSSQGMD